MEAFYFEVENSRDIFNTTLLTRIRDVGTGAGGGGEFPPPKIVFFPQKFFSPPPKKKIKTILPNSD